MAGVFLAAGFAPPRGWRRGMGPGSVGVSGLHSPLGRPRRLPFRRSGTSVFEAGCQREGGPAGGRQGLISLSFGTQDGRVLDRNQARRAVVPKVDSNSALGPSGGASQGRPLQLDAGKRASDDLLPLVARPHLVLETPRICRAWKQGLG